MKKFYNILIVTSLIVALGAPAALANGNGVNITGIVRCSPTLIVSDAQLCAPWGCWDLGVNTADKIPCAQAVSKAVYGLGAFCSNSNTLETILIGLIVSSPAGFATNNGSQYTFSGKCGAPNHD